MEDYLTTDELCEKLKITRQTLYRWIKEDYFPVIKVGRVLRFSPQKVEEWVAAKGAVQEGPIYQSEYLGYSIRGYIIRPKGDYRRYLLQVYQEQQLSFALWSYITSTALAVKYPHLSGLGILSVLEERGLKEIYRRLNSNDFEQGKEYKIWISCEEHPKDG
jgi:excisionase family DNA binding protein